MKLQKVLSNIYGRIDIPLIGGSPRYSLAKRLIIALALSIIFGSGAAASAYFFTHGKILWTAVSGGGGGALTALTSFVALSCIRKKVQKRVLKPPTVSTQVKKEEEQKVEEKIQTKDSFLPFVDSAAQLAIFDTPYKVEKVISMTRNTHEFLLNDYQFELNFVKNMKEEGIVFFDPTNELPVPFLRLYQSLLLDSRCIGEKREILIKLFAEELEDCLIKSIEKAHPRKGFTIDNINSIQFFDNELKMSIKFFDIDTIKSIRKCIKNEKLKKRIKNYCLANDVKFKRSVVGRRTLIEQLDIMNSKYSFGVALDDGSCFFHTMAQHLSNLLNTTITEKQLRLQCIEYRKKTKNKTFQNFSILEEEKWSTYEIWMHNRRCSTSEVKSPTWGNSGIHGQMICDLYGINIVIYEAPVNEDGRLVYTPCPTTIKPHQEDYWITLEDIGVNNIPQVAGQTVYIANMDAHYFPIRILD